jgi:hypothetical protein
VAAFATIAGSGALWFRRAFQLRIPRDRRGFVAAWLAGGALALLAFSQGPGWLGGSLAALALLGSVFFCLTVLVSPQRVGEDAVAVGDPIPAFQAPDDRGAIFDSASLAGHPVLIKFFRGHW